MTRPAAPESTAPPEITGRPASRHARPRRSPGRAPAHGQRAHAAARPRGRAGRALALTLAGTLTFGVAAVATVYLRLEHNITPVDADSLLKGADRPAPAVPDPTDPYAETPVTFLVIASDDRSGDNAALGGESPGMRSDTTMLVHLSGDRTRVDVVSIPRDTLVDVPACPTTHGEIPARSGVMFNSAFAFGWDRGQDLESAAACTVRAAEAVSGVRMDGFVVVDFAGFVAMVDALEGVPITLDQAIDAPEADLLLPAGPQVLDGRQALGLARARSGAGLDGSDLRRIDRQHDLVDAMTARLVEQDLLADAPRLLRFLDAATSSLSASPGLSSLQDLAGIAMSLDEVAADDVVVLTPEVARAPSNKNRVVFTGAADAVWDRLRLDLPVDGRAG